MTDDIDSLQSIISWYLGLRMSCVRIVRQSGGGEASLVVGELVS